MTRSVIPFHTEDIHSDGKMAGSLQRSTETEQLQVIPMMWMF